MKVALFTETFLPKIDGVTNTLSYVLEYLARHGHESILFAPDGGPERYHATQVYGYVGYSFPIYPELRFVPPHVKVADRLRRFNPDVVHVLNPLSLGLAGQWHAKQLGIPVVASFHTDVPGFARRWGFGAVSEGLNYYVRWVHNQADLNLVPSQTTLRELSSMGYERLKVWTRGVDQDLFNPRQRDDEWRYRLTDGHPEDMLMVVVSRVSKEKRIDLLRDVLDATPGLRLAIVGDGPTRPELEQVFKGTKTVFTGFLKGVPLAKAYAAGDLFVFPSAVETLGNVLLEAMASGLPVVAAKIGGPLDIVFPGENGLFFEPFDQDDLVRQVQRLVKDAVLRREIGVRARAYAETRSWDTEMQKLFADYAALAAGQPVVGEMAAA